MNKIVNWSEFEVNKDEKSISECIVGIKKPSEIALKR